MRRIEKGREPEILGQQRRVSREALDAGYREVNKQPLQAQLCKEQGFLCAFCMQRISADGNGMRIAHFFPQSRYIKAQSDPSLSPVPDESSPLDWKNLLGVCHGNQFGNTRAHATCDNRQGNETLEPALHPASRFFDESRFKYLSNGTLCVKDSDLDTGSSAQRPESDAQRLQDQLGRPARAPDARQGNQGAEDRGGLLNLNHAKLMRNRASMIAELIARLRSSEDWTKPRLEKELNFWRSGKNGHLEPYCGVIESYLQRKIAQLPS